ncbi:MAG: hypothetical protein DLM68_14360 [Hyphomicrobiales bacterium]|nr:MAG: hypothetical protein DLM68_14360 [Hyphomicrobiales bacterium]
MAALPFNGDCAAGTGGFRSEFAVSPALDVGAPEPRSLDIQFLKISSAIACNPNCSNGSPCFVHGFLKSSVNFFSSGQFTNRVNQRKVRLEYNASICCRSASPPDANCFNLTSSAVSNPS